MLHGVVGIAKGGGRVVVFQRQLAGLWVSS